MVIMGVRPELIADLDDPADVDDLETTGVTTARPAFEPSELARRIEASGHLSTQPPEPTCEMLRDSCRAIRFVERALAEIEDGWSDEEKSALLEVKKK